MKTTILKSRFAAILFAALLFSAQSFGQSIRFGTEVSSSGYLQNESRSFTIAPEGSYLYFFVEMPRALGYNTDVDYVIYKIDEYGKEKYETTITQPIQSDWTYFWKQINFYSPGRYKVYVYEDYYDDYYDGYITSGELNISYR